MSAEKTAQLMLRGSLGIVFLSFGIGKFQGDIWAQTMAAMEFFQKLPWSVEISIKSAGVLEVLTGSFLILGVWTRLAAIVAAIQLTLILILLGFQEIRDVGLLGVSLYLAVAHDGPWGINRFLFGNRKGER